MDLIERLRLLEQDHEPDGWPAVRMRDITAILDALEAARDGAEDAARYRWLRDSPCRPCRVPCAYAFMPGDVEHLTPIGGAKLDAAIDQARGKGVAE